jgi:hypothetical protein
MKKQYYIIFAFIGVVFVYAIYKSETSRLKNFSKYDSLKEEDWKGEEFYPTYDIKEKPLFADEDEKDKEWYEGGNLHDGDVSDWNRASYKNKLATCADFVAKLYQGQFERVDEIRPYAGELVGCIDEAIKADYPNIEKEDIAGFAVLCMTTMGGN